MTIAVKNYAKLDITFWKSCQILLYFFSLWQMFCLEKFVWKILLRSEWPQVNWYLISSISNLVHELSHELLYDFRLRILGNYKILEKCQIRVETQPSAPSSFQKWNVDNSCKRTRKIRYYIVKVLPNFTVLL